MHSPPSAPASRRLRPALLALRLQLGVALLFAGSASAAWTTNLVQLDNGTCGRNLQIGSDKTASSSNTPTFWLMGDGGLSSYAVAIDGVSIGTFNSAGNGNVCITTDDRARRRCAHADRQRARAAADDDRLAVRVHVDTVPPPAPTVPVLSGVQRLRRRRRRHHALPQHQLHRHLGRAALDSALQRRGRARRRQGRRDGSLVGDDHEPQRRRLQHRRRRRSTARATRARSRPPCRSRSTAPRPRRPSAPTLDPSSDTAPVGDNTTTQSTPGRHRARLRPTSRYWPSSATARRSAPRRRTRSHVWRFTLPALSAGTHSIQVKAGDLADNISGLSTALAPHDRHLDARAPRARRR